VFAVHRTATRAENEYFEEFLDFNDTVCIDVNLMRFFCCRLENEKTL
jgi:hypothetical protein